MYLYESTEFVVRAARDLMVKSVSYSINLVSIPSSSLIKKLCNHSFHAWRSALMWYKSREQAGKL